MNTKEIYKRISESFMKDATEQEKQAYIRGFIDGTEEAYKAPDDFYSQLATGLRELWPKGQKSEKYSWRGSQNTIRSRIEFLWRDRKFGNKYDLNYCLSIARKYLAQFEENVTYMQTLKYFILKQNKISDSKGKVKATYQSTFADLLESETSFSDASLFSTEDASYVDQFGEIV